MFHNGFVRLGFFFFPPQRELLFAFSKFCLFGFCFLLSNQELIAAGPGYYGQLRIKDREASTQVMQEIVKTFHSSCFQNFLIKEFVSWIPM